MNIDVSKQLILLAERAGVKPNYRRNVASILRHCRSAADLENSLAELSRSQSDWFHSVKRRAA